MANMERIGRDSPQRLRFARHGFMTNVADPNQIKCETCQQLFRTDQGLQNHQSRDNPNNWKCHRQQTWEKRKKSN